MLFATVFAASQGCNASPILKQGIKFLERLPRGFDAADAFEVVTFHHVRHGEVIAPIGIGRIKRGERAIAFARDQFGIPRACCEMDETR